jgi:hypothetical protein
MQLISEIRWYFGLDQIRLRIRSDFGLVVSFSVLVVAQINDGQHHALRHDRLTSLSPEKNHTKRKKNIKMNLAKMKNIKIYLTKMIKRMKKYAKMKNIKTNSDKIKVSSQILLNQLNILNTESNFCNHTHVKLWFRPPQLSDFEN